MGSVLHFEYSPGFFLHFDISPRFNLHLLSSHLHGPFLVYHLEIPVTSVCQWCHHQSTKISEVFEAVHNLRCYHANAHDHVFPIIAQLRDPTEVSSCLHFPFRQFLDYISSCKDKSLQIPSLIILGLSHDQMQHFTL